MKVDIFNEGNTYTAILCGKLDTINSIQFEETVELLIKNADKTIIIDCTQLSYICSSGLNQFLSINKEVKKNGGDLSIRLTSPNDELMRILKITHFDKMIRIIIQS